MRNKKINKDKKYTERILEQAVRIGNLDIVNDLLDNGAKINNKKFSPLLSALNSKNFDIAKILILRGADPRDRCPGRTPGHPAFPAGPAHLRRCAQS